MAVDLNDDVIFGADLDFRLRFPLLVAGVEFVQDLRDWPNEAFGDISGADDRALDGSDGHVQEVVAVGPGYFGRVLVMVFSEEKS